MLLRSPAPGDQPFRALLDGAGSDDERPWWMPSLVLLTGVRDDLGVEARRILADWTSRRHDAFYTVVQEETDDHLSLTASGWPLVDGRGRLRFAVTDDPVELHAERDELQTVVDAHRERWRRLGLVGPEQATAPIRLGDTFAMHVERPDGRPVRLREHPLRRSASPAELHLVPERADRADGRTTDATGAADAMDAPPAMAVFEERHAGGRRRRRRLARTAGLVIDITWDARQAGKVAQLAAFAGVLTPETPETPGTPGAAGAAGSPATTTNDDELIAEGLDRQLRAYLAGLGPDEAVALDDDTDHTTGDTTGHANGR